MSNDRWMEKLKNWSPKEEKETRTMTVGKKYCKDFEKGMNGLCKYYMGCKIISRTCADECAYR